MKLKIKKQLEKIKPNSGSLGRVIQLTKTPATQRKKEREREGKNDPYQESKKEHHYRAHRHGTTRLGILQITQCAQI